MNVKSHSPDGYPTYAELLVRTDAPRGSSWNVFGKGDERGTVNFMTDATVKQAMTCVRRGRPFNLDYPINAFPPNQYRPNATHKIISLDALDARDDYLDNFYLQSTSQIDGLRHIRHHIHGFYGGVPDSEINEDSPTLGIGRWAAGIIGRGVLLDVGRYLEKQGTRIDLESAFPIDVALLDAVARDQGVTFSPGGVLMIRTGWAHYLLSDAAKTYRESKHYTHNFPGLKQSRETLEWLWDNRFAVAAADNIALEVSPAVPTTPFTSPTETGYMHQEMIAMLGLVIGELWALEELAADCAADGTYDCAVVLKPLNVTAGAGSPANAVAIR